MEKITPLTASVLGVGILFIAASTAFARSHRHGGSGSGGGASNVIGLCWTDPASSSALSTSSSSDLVSANYGVIFELEPGNGNEIAADVYTLDSNRQKIKQVGHADVTATVSESGEATFTSAVDSPSQFSLTLLRQEESSSASQVSQESGDPRDRGSITGELTNAVLFTGEAASNVALRCRAVGFNSLPVPTPSASPVQ